MSWLSAVAFVWTTLSVPLGPIGTLGLELEGSVVRGVGTLGLELEGGPRAALSQAVGTLGLELE